MTCFFVLVASVLGEKPWICPFVTAEKHKLGDLDLVD